MLSLLAAWISPRTLVASLIPNAQSPVQPGIARGYRSAPAVAKIQRPSFAVSYARGRAPLPACQLDARLYTIGGLGARLANQSLEVVDRRQPPIVKAAKFQIAAVALRLQPAQAGAVIGGSPHLVSGGIGPHVRSVGALAQHRPPERPQGNCAGLQRLATSAAGRATDAVLCTLPPASRRSMIEVKSFFSSLLYTPLAAEAKPE